MREPGAFEFRVLGRVEATRDGVPLSVGGARQRALLALLLLEPGRAVGAERLVDELWEGAPPEGAATTLRSYVSRLRRVLGAEVVVAGGSTGYVLQVPPESVDAVRFERLLKDGERALEEGAAQRAAERLTACLALWHGRAFDDAGAEGAVRAEAERLEELRIRALSARIDADLALGRSAELVEELEGLARRFPHRERFWRQLMLALYRAGRQADALAAYQRARTQLVDELGIEPGEELRELEQAILRQEVAPAGGHEHHHNLPAAVTSFVGREVELAELHELAERQRLITLTGVGGAGKTRLALELAAQLVPEHPDGVWCCDLAPIADASGVIREVARMLEVREQPDVALEDLLTRRLREAGALLVLDNCEHVRPACAELVRTLLTRSPRLRVIATSRVPLGMPGEVEYAVPPLALSPPAAGPEELRSSESVRLFLARAQAARSCLVVDDAVLMSAARICRQLDGLPLAIELAAARAKALSLDDIADRLTDRFRFLVSWRRLSPARHRTLREAMDWSYELLSPDERAFLEQLSVFTNGCDLLAAARVCCQGQEGQALELVERLVDASLVLAVERDGEMRYRMLETVREHASEHLAPVQRVLAEQAHTDYFFELSEARSREVEELGSLTPLTTLAPDDANLLSALHRLREAGDSDRELRMCAALWRYWWLRGHVAEGRRLMEGALAQPSPGASAAAARALRGASHLAHRQGDLEEAVALGEQSAVLSAQLGDDLGVARAHMAVANAASSLGDLARAEDLYRASEAAFRAAGADWDLATVLLDLGDLALGRGDLDETDRVATESLAWFRRTGDDSGAAANLVNIGFARLQRGESGRAATALTEALLLAHRLGFGEWIAAVLLGLAAAAADEGDDVRAVRLLGASEALREDVGVSLDRFEQRLYEQTLAGVQARLDPQRLSEGWAHGRQLPSSEVLAYALAQPASTLVDDT